jgi:hypothetical protein
MLHQFDKKSKSFKLPLFLMKGTEEAVSWIPVNILRAVCEKKHHSFPKLEKQIR